MSSRSIAVAACSDSARGMVVRPYPCGGTVQDERTSVLPDWRTASSRQVRGPSMPVTVNATRVPQLFGARVTSACAPVFGSVADTVCAPGCLGVPAGLDELLAEESVPLDGGPSQP